MASNDLLFSQYALRGALEQHASKVRDAIGSLSASQIEGNAGDSVVAELEKQYHVAPLVLLENGMAVEHEETKVDVSQDPRRTVFDRTRPCYIPGRRVRYRYRSKETP